MNHFGDQVVAVLTAIIGVAILSVILSRNSNTASVISSAARGFSEALSTAVSPITGNVSLAIGPTGGFAGSSYNGLAGGGFPSFV